MKVELHLVEHGNHSIILATDDGEHQEELNFEWFEAERAKKIAAILEEDARLFWHINHVGIIPPQDPSES